MCPLDVGITRFKLLSASTLLLELAPLTGLGDFHDRHSRCAGDVNRYVGVDAHPVSSVGGNGVDLFSILHDVDDSGIHVADIDRIVGGDFDPAARRKRPGFDEFTVLVEDGNTLIVTVVDEDPAFGIERNAVR